MSKTALLTGASGEIGGAIARTLSSAGYRLVLTGNRHMDRLRLLEDELRKSGADIRTVQADLADAASCRKLFDLCVSEFDVPDLVVNNAGISHVSLIQDSSEEDLQLLLQTNLASCIRICKEAARLMIPRHCGRIINISSVYGVSGASCEAEYAAAKGAVNAFTKSLAKELAPSGISCNALAPGAIDTRMNAHLTELDRRVLTEEIPAGRMGTPEEVAECVRLLAQAPLYLTGQIIAVDGGWY